MTIKKKLFNIVWPLTLSTFSSSNVFTCQNPKRIIEIPVDIESMHVLTYNTRIKPAAKWEELKNGTILPQRLQLIPETKFKYKNSMDSEKDPTNS